MSAAAKAVVVAVAAVPIVVAAVIHFDSVARLTAAGAAVDGLLRTHALLAAAGAILAGGVASWWLGLERAPTGVATAGVDSPQAANAEVSRVGDVRRLRDELEAALAREREFSGHLAHELRTPLAVLRTGLELARRRKPPSEGADDPIGELIETVDDMGRMVGDLLMLARLGGADQSPRTPVALGAVVDATWRRLEAKASARELTFHNELLEGFTILGDRDKLQIVVQNLLGNAVSYTDKGGTICVRSPKPGVVEVWDSGPQLDPAHLPRVFDRMWRGDPARTDATQHAGLGLSLARALCSNMAMSLSVANAADGGLVFAITDASSSMRTSAESHA